MHVYVFGWVYLTVFEINDQLHKRYFEMPNLDIL